jgi:hypothetical protein
MHLRMSVALRGWLIVTLVAASARAQVNGPPNLSNPGTSYTVSATGAAGRLGTGSTAPSMLQNYIGHVVFAAGRGRMDIVEGGVESMFGKGDYLLFDSTDVIVVHPSAREFLAIPRDLASRGMDQLEAMGLHVAIADEKVTLDSINVGDTVAGLPTRHFRMTVAFNMAMDAGLMQQRLGTESVIDYWVTSSSLVPPNPLLRANGFAVGPMTGGMFRTLSSKVDSVAAKMGTTSALKTRAITRLMTGPGKTVETQQVYEISDIAQRDVDDDLLVLPAGLSAAALPGTELSRASLDSLSAKWRAPPAARQKAR